MPGLAKGTQISNAGFFRRCHSGEAPLRLTPESYNPTAQRVEPLDISDIWVWYNRITKLKFMGKKFKKSAREINRLASLYQKPVQSNTTEMPIVQGSTSAIPTTIQTKEQAVIRHDLIVLTIVIAVVLVAMFALNYLIVNTALGGILTNAISRVI